MSQLKYKGVPIKGYSSLGVRVDFKTPESFGFNNAQGIHLLAPSQSEINEAIKRAKYNGFKTVFVYGFIRNEFEGLE